MAETRNFWAALWRSDCALDGARSHVLNHIGGIPALFRSRKEARAFIDKEYGYIRTRPDLRQEPHGWKIPIAIRVRVTIRSTTRTTNGK